MSKQVRAGSLQELVYKQGQAGVTRATVTVVFSNKDKNQSPVGYEAYDEIAVCRQVLNL
jgi:structural maintenance of chromosome 2